MLALEFKAKIIDHLKGQGHEVQDHGPFEYDALDDYPVFLYSGGTSDSF